MTLFRRMRAVFRRMRDRARKFRGLNRVERVLTRSLHRVQLTRRARIGEVGFVHAGCGLVLSIYKERVELHEACRAIRSFGEPAASSGTLDALAWRSHAKA